MEHQFDMERAKVDGFRIKLFPSYDLEWLDYVVSCRRGKDYSSEYDVVESTILDSEEEEP